MDKPLIIVKVIGGLGNQMFQYAAGRALASRIGGVLKLDLTDFATYEYHQYSLNKLAVEEILASEEEIKYFTKYTIILKSLPKLFRLPITRLGLDKRLFAHAGYVQEKQSTFEPEVFSLQKSAYLEGYWQSEKYFSDIRNVLLKEFDLKTPFGAAGQTFADAINSTVTPICIHIRRGDFANNPTISKFHGTCSLEYYHNAVTLLSKSVQDPSFFVFSDDIKWAKQNFTLDAPVKYVGQGADKNHEDIALMRLCKHFVLSNSTFGWWAAWLSNSPDKIVVAPDRWARMPLNVSDLLPPSWVQLPTL